MRKHRHRLKKTGCGLIGRPRMRRNIEFHPRQRFFKPQGMPMRGLEIIEITVEELEALRLKYVEELNQTECARLMKTSQSTLQRILASANKKVAQALVKGKAIKIIKYNS